MMDIYSKKTENTKKNSFLQAKIDINNLSRTRSKNDDLKGLSSISCRVQRKGSPIQVSGKAQTSQKKQPI
jgi:hypothetical protein